MEESLFTKIIKGDIPAHKVYEDEKTLAFLTISPVLPGHVLVIPKVQVDHIDDLEDEDYQAVWATVKKVAKRVTEVYGSDRAIIHVMGFEVPHAHVHVVPSSSGNDYIIKSYEHVKEAIENGSSPIADDAELKEIAQKLAFLVPCPVQLAVMSNAMLAFFMAAGVAGFAYSKLGRRVGYGNSIQVWQLVAAAFVFTFLFVFSLLAWVI